MYKDESRVGRRQKSIVVDDRELTSKDYTREKVYPIPVNSARRETEDRIYLARNKCIHLTNKPKGRIQDLSEGARLGKLRYAPPPPWGAEQRICEFFSFWALVPFEVATQSL